ncbi:MAG: helix-turn-helix transcriptional regulator [Ferruginibacter sp.]
MVQSFWQAERQNGDMNKETIIPKGVVEIIFSFEDHTGMNALLNGKMYSIPKCCINGYNTMPIYLNLAARQHFFGVVFHPAAVKKIFGIPAGEFANLCVDMTLINTAFNSLWQALAEEKSFEKRIYIFSNWLQKKLAGISLQEEAFNDFLNNKNTGDISVTGLANLLCYSPRQLSRKLQAATGMNTEETLLYKKYLQSVELIHHSTGSLTEIAYACNFSDQSHFIKTFRSFTQLTPGGYKNSRSNIAGHIYGNVR